MHAEFTIEVDATNSLIQVTMSGFFTLDDTARFVAARNAAHDRLLCPQNQHLTLVDIRGMAVQSQAAVTAFQAALSVPKMRSKRLAFVVAKSLSRTQLRRAAEKRDAGYFTDPAEARAWLLDAEAIAA